MGSTWQRCKNRQDILLDVLKVAGLPLSPKCNFKVSETVKLIGLHWTAEGHCLDDEAVESLLLTLPGKKAHDKNRCEADHRRHNLLYVQCRGAGKACTAHGDSERCSGQGPHTVGPRL